jgi:D-sedoheptulose 7-phosphate isomerase
MLMPPIASVAVTAKDFDAYVGTLAHVLEQTQVTDGSGLKRDIAGAINWVTAIARAAHAAGNKLVFVGNGGSAAICSHMAVDYSKNGDIRALALNDGAMLTCLGNDCGYEDVFSRQIDMHCRNGDVLIAISSSGRSRNIINAVSAARQRKLVVITLSGFSENNTLRATGDMNFYLQNDQYGFVEIGHLTLCHAILDFALGWRCRIADGDDAGTIERVPSAQDKAPRATFVSG